jgi:hypothetical protein
MAKKVILAIFIILMSSLFLGCIDTKSAGLGSIGGTTDLIAKSEKSGIFSEDVDGITKPQKGSFLTPSTNIQLNGYQVIYNNGNTLTIRYSHMYDQYYNSKPNTEQVARIEFHTKGSNNEKYQVSLENEKPEEYYYSCYKDDETYYENIHWDDMGRVDPRSEGNVDRANKFIEAGLKKGKEVKERFYAKELGDWS